MKKNGYIHLGSLITGLIAFSIYSYTLEPTASFWDCGEFIACASKLSIAHPPGAPVFLLFGRLFSLLAGDDPGRVAYWVNMLSAVASAATIFFLYHTIVWFVKKLVDAQEPQKHLLITISAGLGALSFAFTDSFWFSAVEGEVYATSSLFTAMVFWAILRWETTYSNDTPDNAFHWILLICFILGLSIGIHLLNLLAIPAIVLIIHYKTQKNTGWGIFKSFLISALLLGFIVFLLIPGVAKTAANLDLILVNSFNQPVNSGLIFFMVIMFLGFVGMLILLRKKKKLLAYKALLGMAMLLLGYSSYSTVIIRSLAKPAINMNNPDNAFSLLHYLNREQYGSRSLIRGPYFNAPVLSTEERTSKTLQNGKYIDDPLNPKVRYDERFITFFPRMSDRGENHADAYRKWGKVNGTPVQVRTRHGTTETRMKPSFSENLRFFFRYQIGHMYLRYFMWNFVGRQDDVQGFGSIDHGNWLSGIHLIDNLRLGNQNRLPDPLINNKGRNTYYFLPLIFGLAGISFQYKNHRSGFWTLLTLFIFTGIAIVVYLNEIPITPRERDYVYVGSFYVFTIWIGLAVPLLHGLIKKYLPSGLSLLIISLGSFAAVPGILFSQNFDDHNRRNRYIARDMGENYLNSCRENAILFTSADNDTYPLWYCQEVEGIRTDVRQVLQPYLSANWYIEQQRNDRPGSAGLPLSFPADSFLNGRRDYIPVVERLKQTPTLNQLLEFVRSGDPRTRVMQGKEQIDYLPASGFNLTVPQKQDASEVEFIHITLKKSYLLKSDLIILDVIAQNQWKRPIYFLNPQVATDLGFGEYLVREGLAYRLAPEKKYDVEINHKLFTETFQWGNFEDKNVYTDWTIRRNLGLVLRVREQYSTLANHLLNKGKTKEAREALLYCLEQFPENQLEYGAFSLDLINSLVRVNETDKALELYNRIKSNRKAYLQYVASLKPSLRAKTDHELQTSLYIWQRLTQIASHHQWKDAEEMQKQWIQYARIFRLA